MAWKSIVSGIKLLRATFDNYYIKLVLGEIAYLKNRYLFILLSRFLSFASSYSMMSKAPKTALNQKLRKPHI